MSVTEQADKPSKPNVYAVYMESRDRIKAGRGDSRDFVFVETWNKSMDLIALRDKLNAENTALRKQVRELTYNNDLLETKNAMLLGTHIEGLCEEVQFPNVQH